MSEMRSMMEICIDNLDLLISRLSPQKTPSLPRDLYISWAHMTRLAGNLSIKRGWPWTLTTLLWRFVHKKVSFGLNATDFTNNQKDLRASWYPIFVTLCIVDFFSFAYITSTWWRLEMPIHNSKLKAFLNSRFKIFLKLKQNAENLSCAQWWLF